MNPDYIKPGESLYRDEGLKVYEASHYDDGSHLAEVKAILGWLPKRRGRVLDLGCSGGLHSAELARRGLEVTGVDREPDAIALARRRFGSLPGLGFQVLDLETADLSPLSGAGRFTLVMGLGNVLSHLPRARLPGLFRGVRGLLGEGGCFLFDVLHLQEPFEPRLEMHDTRGELRIVWERELDRATGVVDSVGHFLHEGYRARFLIQAYSVEEITGVLRSAGFPRVDYCPTLDFQHPQPNPPALYYRCLE